MDFTKRIALFLCCISIWTCSSPRFGPRRSNNRKNNIRKRIKRRRAALRKKRERARQAAKKAAKDIASRVEKPDQMPISLQEAQTIKNRGDEQFASLHKLYKQNYKPLALRAPFLHYHEVTWVSPHNTFASFLPTSGPLDRQLNYYHAQQLFTLKQMLDIGVRVFDLDIHEDKAGIFKQGEIYMAHGSMQTDRFLRAKPFIAPRTLRSAYTLFKEFLEDHPHEILTIFHESYVPDKKLDALVKNMDLDRFVLRPNEWDPTTRNGWPTLGEMVEKNKRLLFFKGGSQSRYMYATKYAMASTRYSSVDLDTVSQLHPTSLKMAHPLYLLSSSLSPATPFPLPPEDADTFFKKAKYVIENVNEFYDNNNFKYINSTKLKRQIELLKKRYHHIPNFLGVDHIETYDPFAIAESINKQSIQNPAYRKKWFGVVQTPIQRRKQRQAQQEDTDDQDADTTDESEEDSESSEKEMV